MLATLQSFDAGLLVGIRSFATEHAAFSSVFVKVFADIEVLLVAFLLVALWLFGRFSGNAERKMESLRIFYTVGAAFILYSVLNLVIPMRPRPETVTAIAPMIAHLPDNSFPSGHAIFAGASMFAAFRFLRGRIIGWVLLASGILMCFARVFAGVHYVGDVTAGYLLGVMFAWWVSSLVASPSDASALFRIPLRVGAFFRL